LQKNQKVREIIEASLNQLEEQLQEQGVEIGAMQVSVQQDNQTNPFEAFEQEQQKSASRINDIINGINAEYEESEEEEILEKGSTISIRV